jgi:hypothetical protein
MNDTNSNDTAPVAGATAAAVVTAVVAPRLVPAIAAGLAAAIVGAIAWAAITRMTDTKLGLLAVAVGALIGVAVRRTGRSGGITLAVVGGGCAVVGCMLGDLFTAAAYSVDGGDASLVSAALRALSPSVAPDILAATFTPMTLVFNAIAIYEGFTIARKAA